MMEGPSKTEKQESRKLCHPIIVFAIAFIVCYLTWIVCPNKRREVTLSYFELKTARTNTNALNNMDKEDNNNYVRPRENVANIKNGGNVSIPLDENLSPRYIKFCNTSSLNYVTVNSTTANNSGRTIQILMWQKVRYFPYENFKSCKYNNCRIIYKREYIRNSDAVVFNAQYLKIGCMPPKVKGQIWILLSTETPVYTSIFQKSLFSHMFNWTWTYRRDSDIPIYFGGIEKMNTSLKLNVIDSLTSKTRPVVVISSHCRTDGKREKYIEALKSYIDIDAYGVCGPLNVIRERKHLKALQILNTTYKFYLSFENSLCRDYISEKVLRVLRVNIVPVVRGGAFYHLYVPAISYINTQNFKDPSSLAKYLQNLSNDINIYKKFYEWRKYYKARNSFNWNLCELCKHLNHKQDHTSLYEDIQEWIDGKHYKSFCSTPRDVNVSQSQRMKYFRPDGIYESK